CKTGRTLQVILVRLAIDSDGSHVERIIDLSLSQERAQIAVWGRSPPCHVREKLAPHRRRHGLIGFRRCRDGTQSYLLRRIAGISVNDRAEPGYGRFRSVTGHSIDMLPVVGQLRLGGAGLMRV